MKNRYFYLPKMLSPQILTPFKCIPRVGKKPSIGYNIPRQFLEIGDFRRQDLGLVSSLTSKSQFLSPKREICLKMAKLIRKCKFPTPKSHFFPRYREKSF